MKSIPLIVFTWLCLLVVPFAFAADVEFETSKGTIIIEVDEENAPISAANFLQYAEDGFYDGLIFHRVIPNFVIQGGGFTPNLKMRETRPPIRNEADNGLKNKRYSLSMARTNDPHSATSQFFINLQDNDFLNFQAGNPGYAVFGHVKEGMDVVDDIAAVATDNEVPKEAVIITQARVLSR